MSRCLDTLTLPLESGAAWGGQYIRVVDVDMWGAGNSGERSRMRDRPEKCRRLKVSMAG